jgi:Zn-dependent protease
MRDPFTWSLPLGRFFGITVRMHILFVILILVIWLRVAMASDTEGYPPGSAAQILIVLGMLWLSVLLHEFGHCFGARLMDGEANEVLLWPLGGLAYCDVPHTPKANFVCTVCGPLTNLLLCVLAGGALALCSIAPSLDPRTEQLWRTPLYNWAQGTTFGSSYAPDLPQLEYWQVLAARFFWLNWWMFLFNMLVLGFPLDGGRLVQALLWPRLGYRQSMMTAIFLGFVFMFIIAIYALMKNELLALCLAMFIYVSCKQQWIQLETGSEDTLFGYDFSQGYTSLERDQPPPPRKKRPNFFQRWLQRRAARKLQREQEQQANDERRMDELLQKIQREGKQALTDEENRFLKRVADKYRNRPS